MKALLTFAPLYMPQWKRLVVSLTLGGLTLLAGALLLGVSGWFLTAAALTTVAASFNLFGPSSLIRGLSLLRILSRYGERVSGHDATLRLLADIRGWLFARLFLRLPIADRSLAHGDLVSRLTADIDALDTIFLVAIGPFLSAIGIVALMSAVLFWTAPTGAIVYMIAMGLAIFVVPMALVLLTGKIGAELVSHSATSRSLALRGIEGHKDLLAFGQLDQATSGFSEALLNLGSARRRLALRASGASAAIQLLAGLALAGVLWFGLAAYREGALDASWLVGLLLATVASFEAANVVVRSVAKFGIAIAAAGRIKALAGAPITVGEPGKAVPLPAKSEIRIEDVTFGYPGQKPSLRGIDLEVAPGDRVALVGLSGSGKSTLLSLLVRLHDPDAGNVRLGGMDIRNVSLADLRSRIALMTQESHVFMGTIRDNLLIGNANATEAAMWHSLANIRLSKLVKSLPRGLDTFVGELGATLSVGQARRLCLARTLLSDADVLLFDEPTSGLDRETELAFLGDLLRVTAGRTVIIATHATLPKNSVHRIYRLIEGQLVQAAAAFND